MGTQYFDSCLRFSKRWNCLGEQSVGKSFSLNHLVDTSFAGSAMRTTGKHNHLASINLHLPTRCRGCLDVCNTHRWFSHCSIRLWRFINYDMMVSIGLKRVHQAFTVSNDLRRRTRCWYSSTPPSRTWWVLIPQLHWHDLNYGKVLFRNNFALSRDITGQRSRLASFVIIDGYRRSLSIISIVVRSSRSSSKSITIPVDIGYNH